MSPNARGVLLLALWIPWWLAFIVLRPKNRGKAVQKDPRARWGIMLVGLGNVAIYMHTPKLWMSPLAVWRAVAAVGIGSIGVVLAWTAIAHLGRQWRIDAGLNADHELIRTGPYGIVRHPIYASMLCTMLMSVLLVGTLPGWPIGVVLFLVGTEIRIRVEDGLLRERFGEQFEGWRRAVPAYLPFVH